jgi:hypothetical protein
MGWVLYASLRLQSKAGLIIGAGSARQAAWLRIGRYLHLQNYLSENCLTSGLLGH